jgi:hypothetical protein
MQGTGIKPNLPDHDDELHSWNISNYGEKHVLQSVLKVFEP